MSEEMVVKPHHAPVAGKGKAKGKKKAKTADDGHFRDFCKFPVSLANSIAWLCMDFCWLSDWGNVAALMASSTLLSGFFMLFLYRKREIVYVNIATFCWMLMNACWFFNDFSGLMLLMDIAKVSFFLGLAFLILSVSESKDIKTTMRAFRRVRGFDMEESPEVTPPSAETAPADEAVDAADSLTAASVSR